MLLDGINRQEYVSDRVPMPVDTVADTAFINSIAGEAVQLYYFSNAYLTCGTAGETTAATWAALTNTTKFEIDILGKTYVVNPDFTGDASMNDVAASIQVAIRAVTGRLETCTQGANIITITVAKDESGEGMGNSISVLRNTASNTGVNIAGASWMNGLYGTGVVTPATATTDAGQAAGTLVVAKLAYTGILDHVGAMIGNEKDTSLVWTTNTILPKKYLKEFPKYTVERLTNKEIVEVAYEFGKMLTVNGEWGLDHRTGLIVGRKATTGTADTATYKVQTQASGSGTSIAAAVNLEKINNVDIPLDDAAFTPGASPVIPAGYFADETATDSVNEGDIGAARITLDRKQINASEHIDDAALAGGAYTTVMGARADEVATDSVDEGDAGYLRMTLDRKLLTASQAVDDAAFVASSYITQSGFVADEVATDSVDEGDVGVARMTLNRRIITAGHLVDDTAFGVATDYISPIGYLVDDTATDSVDEGDVGLPRMSADRVSYTQGAVAHDAVDSGNPLKIGGKAETTMPAAVADGDRVDAFFDEYGRLQIKDNAAWDAAALANKVVEQTPLSDHVVADTATVLTNITTNTTGYIYIDMDTYKNGSLQIITDGTTPTDTLTLTLEASNQDDGTAQASCAYSDVSLELMGVASVVDVDASGRSSFFVFLDTAIICKYLRIKYVTSNGGGNDADLTVYPRKAY